MSVTLWRIGTDTPAYTADDRSGTGAKLTGGRWNRVGNPVVYTASSIALACLETIVHLGASGLPYNRYLVRFDVPDYVWQAAGECDPNDPRLVGWDAQPAGAVSLDAGDEWLASATSALLRVPSVIVQEEWNVLINPLHPDSGKLAMTKVRKFLYDVRLTRKE